MTSDLLNLRRKRRLEYSREWQRRNKDRINAKRKARRLEKLDQYRCQARVYYSVHKDEITGKRKLDYKANADKYRAKKLAYYHANKERISRRREELRQMRKKNA